MVRAAFAILAGSAAFLVIQPALAAGAPRQSSDDACNLAMLAPPARLSTRNATYGDARLVRPLDRRAARRATGADAPLGLYVCRDRTLCVRDLRRIGFRDLHTYTPSYATAPQVPRDGLGRNPSLLPPATAFFYSANEQLFGNPPGE